MADPAIATPPATAPAAAAPTPAPAGGQAPQQPAAAAQPSLLTPDKPQVEAPKQETPKAPAEIKLTLPKDSLLTQSHVDKIAAIARERGLSQEVAEAVMKSQAEQLKEFADGHVKAWQDRVTGWEKELRAHKEFGGEKLKEFDAGASEVVMKYGGENMLKLLKESGYGKNPEVAQFLWNIHKAMRPDKIVAPQAQSTGDKPGLAERLFPSMTKKNG